MSHFGAADAAAFALYMALLIGIGVWFTRQQKDLKSYLLADRDMNAVIVAVSVIAALFSGISYLGAPAETYHNGLAYLLVLGAYFIATPITIFLFVPYFYRLNLYTAYEYLEWRFDGRVRRLASLLFILRVTGWIAIAIYAPALAISTATGWPLWAAILLTGAATTFYTALGGMKAVIWTDTIQFFLLCLGIFFVLYHAAHGVPGGLHGAWDLAAADGKTRLLDLSLDPRVRLSLGAALIGGTAANLVQMVTDQIAVQRYLTARSLRECQRALWIKLWVTIPIVAFVYLTGTFLYGYYRANPSLTPTLERTDGLLPYFISTTLPAPLPGLLFASIFAATMSAASAGINALTSALLIDFGKGLRPGQAEADAAGDRRQVFHARLVTTAFGVLTTILALFVGHLGTLVEAPNRIFGLLGGPLLGVFFLGVCSRRTGGLAALIGMAVGAAATLAAQAANFSFLWLAFVGASATYLTGWLLARWLPATDGSAAVAAMHGRAGILPAVEEPTA